MTTNELAALFTTYYQPLCSFAYSILFYRNLQDYSHDIVSDVLINVYNNDKFEYNHPKMKTFLWYCVKNKCYDTIVHRKYAENRLHRLKDEIVPYDLINMSHIESPMTFVMSAIGALPAMQREVITHRYINDLSIREVSDILGIAERTVINHRTAAIKKLKSLLA